jgi:hypothetical protein
MSDKLFFGVLVTALVIAASMISARGQGRSGLSPEECQRHFAICKARMTQQVGADRASIICSRRVSRCTTTGTWRR